MKTLAKRAREAAPPALFYLATLLVAITLSIFTHREKVGWADGYLVWAIPTALGVLAGQFAFLLRLRTWVVLSAGVSWVVAGYYGFPYLLQQDWFPGKDAHPLFVGGLGPTFLWYLTLWTPMFSLGGLFSLRRPWGVLAFWFPTIFFMKATIPFINLDQEWLEGRKWTVWTPGTLLVAVGCVVLFLFFLTWRERRRISQWSTGQPRAWRLEGGGRGVWRRAIEATVLVLILSASTALISPFLWNRIRNEKGTEARQGEQTGSDRGQNDSASGDRDQSSGNSSEGQPQTDPGRGEGDVSQPAANEPGGGGADSGGESPPDRTQDSSGIEARREGQEGEDSGRDPSSGSGQAPDEESSGSGATSGAAQRILPWLFLLLLWALLWRPLKRLSLIRSWLDPNSRESPTQRIEHAWRAVRTVLEDYRQVPRAAETPASFCRRITETWPGAGESLQSASSVADIRDRVFFGLFVEPGDVENSRQLAAAAYENLWRRQTWWGKLRALYRDLD